MRDTKQRDAIRSALKNAGNRILSPIEILAIAQKDIPNLGIATVYRNIKGMVINGEVKAVTLPGQADRYRLTCDSASSDILINKDGTVTIANFAGVTTLPNYTKRTYFIEE